MIRSRGLLAALVAAAFLGGCGGGDAEEAPEPQPEPRPPETIDQAVKPPTDWKAYVNRAGGFTLALPPGWKAKTSDTSTVIRSFDRLASIEISADRTDEAVAYDRDEFAERALAAIPGFEKPLEPSEPRPYNHHYPATSSRADGTNAKTGVKQIIELIFIQRPELAAYTAVIAAADSPKAAEARKLAARVIRTLRGRPPKT